MHAYNDTWLLVPKFWVQAIRLKISPSSYRFSYKLIDTFSETIWWKQHALKLSNRYNIQWTVSQKTHQNMIFWENSRNSWFNMLMMMMMNNNIFDSIIVSRLVLKCCMHTHTHIYSMQSVFQVLQVKHYFRNGIFWNRMRSLCDCIIFEWNDLSAYQNKGIRI